MPKVSIPYKRTLIHNSQTYVYYYNKFKLFATSIFKWHNLPSTCDERVLENALFYYGAGALVNDKELGALSLNATPNGNLNLYGLPTKISAFGENGFNRFYEVADKEGENGDAIYILNNKNQIPTLWIAQYYAFKIANVQEIIDTNTNAQRTPYIVRANKKQELTIKNALNKMLTNEPYILINDSFKTDNFGVFNTKADFVADKLIQVRKDYENNFYTDLGINNINIFKKERLITDEAEANNESININLNSFLDMRQEGAEAFNKLLGITDPNKKIYVTFNGSILSELKKHGFDENTNLDEFLNSVLENKTNKIFENYGGDTNA